jgi:molybdopterin-binding protein
VKVHQPRLKAAPEAIPCCLPPPVSLPLRLFSRATADAGSMKKLSFLGEYQEERFTFVSIVSFVVQTSSCICRCRDQQKEVNTMELSARNQLKGKVRSVKLGSVMAEVIVELPGGQEIVSAITRSSAENLNLKEGDEVVAVIKSTEVMIGREVS